VARYWLSRIFRSHFMACPPG